MPICDRCSRGKRYCDRSINVPRREDPADALWLAGTDDPNTALENKQVASLLQHYVQKLAAWYDLSDGLSSFAKVVPLAALSDPLLFGAIVAFAAVHERRTSKSPAAAAIAHTFHEDCVKRLIDLDPTHPDYDSGHALAAVCLLRSYELLAENSDPNRHLSGAHALASSCSVDMRHSSLMRAGFYNYLREDITYSLINRCLLKLDRRSITSPQLPSLGAADDEEQLNIASVFLAQVINEVFDPERDKRMLPSKEFRNWRSSLPEQFAPYHTTHGDVDGIEFPTVRLLRDCHVSVLQYCPVIDALSYFPQEDVTGVLEYNATMVCGLTFTSESTAVMVNSYGRSQNGLGIVAWPPRALLGRSYAG